MFYAEKNKKFIIIFCNLIIIIISFLALYDDYKRKGKFQMVDENAIEDSEELFLNPIFLTFIILGIATFIYELMKWNNKVFRSRITKRVFSFLRTMSFSYGFLLIVVSISFILMLIAHIGNNFDTMDIFSLLFLLSLIILGLLGAIIIKKCMSSLNDS